MVKVQDSFWQCGFWPLVKPSFAHLSLAAETVASSFKGGQRKEGDSTPQ